MVETYYSPFTFEIGENAPKLTKQLTKAGKAFTVEEVQAFQELLNAVYDNEKEEAEEGTDGCLYCCDCIHYHLEEDEEE